MSRPARALEAACIALWTATLSLMTAYMQTPAPAHRLLLARRIAANFHTLAQQESFSPAGQASFSRLRQRWQARADALAQPDRNCCALATTAFVRSCLHGRRLVSDRMQP